MYKYHIFPNSMFLIYIQRAPKYFTAFKMRSEQEKLGNYWPSLKLEFPFD